MFRRTRPLIRPGAAKRVAPVLLLALLAGCGGVSARRGVLRDAMRDGAERVVAGRGPGEVTAAILDRQGLSEDARKSPASAALALRERLEHQPSAGPDGALALAELSYRAGLADHGPDPGSATAWYRDAAVLAALALAEPGGARFDRAVAVHNLAVARLVRLSRSANVRRGRPWPQALADYGLVARGCNPYFAPEHFDDLTVAADLKVRGLLKVYHYDGLGVPLVARRPVDPNSPDPRDRYFPRESPVAATAVVIPGGGLAGGAWRRAPATLELYDPFQSREVVVGGRTFGLAADRSTPLAVLVSTGRIALLELAGLFTSKLLGDTRAGLYLLRPYEPGKVPVILVHGLLASPRSFIQTVNELNNDPRVGDKFQFWVFLYPTGRAIPASAARLRKALAQARDTFDPGHADPALDDMVLIGHSMGGVLAKMMVQDTGNALWDASIHIPEHRLKASPKLRAELNAMLVFRPLPYVRRVVFIATPHRGSRVANAPIGRLVSDLVRRDDEQTAAVNELESLNGKDALARELRSGFVNSVGNLRTDSPILATLDRLPIHQGVPYHSIIPLLGGDSGATDGIVNYSSSHLPGATSELIVRGSHFAHQYPEVTAELRRILLEHLAHR